MTTTPMPTTVAPRPTDTTSPPTGVRRVAGALSLPALFLAMLATGPLDPFDDQARASTQLHQATGHLGEVRALGWVELLAAATMIGVVLTFAGLTRGRGRGVANVAVVLGALGAVGMTLVGVHHWVVAAASGASGGAGVVDRLDAIAGPAILPLMVAAPVALLLFAVAGHRAGFVPTPALVLMVVFFLGEAVPVLPGGELLPLLIGLVAFAWTATNLLASPRTTAA